VEEMESGGIEPAGEKNNTYYRMRSEIKKLNSTLLY
jgi:hypothetical protein